MALIIVSVLSLGARSLLLDEPCQAPCTTASAHTLIFDEAYYVNAARVIAGIHPPAGSHYADSPLGTDPNAEHPQGAKLIMAAAIEIFGDGPFAWRIGSLIMGSIALLGMFALVRAAGGDRWTAVGAVALMACDNLLLVHGRIGTLDIYVVAAMIWGVALYVRGRPILAGLALAIADSFKLVAPYALLVIGLVELLRWLLRLRDRDLPGHWTVRAAAGRLAATTFVSIGVFVGILGLMGLVAPPYADSEAKLVTGGPFAHIAHMISYAAQQVSPHGPMGIASYPWDWLIDLKPIVYLRINPSLPGPASLNAIHPVSAFFGMVSPSIMVVAMPALVWCLVRLVRGRPRLPALSAVQPPASPAPVAATGLSDLEMPIVALAWFLGTWIPFALQALLDQRTSYLYYMVIVMPGVYVAAIHAVQIARRRRTAWLSGVTVAWGLSVLITAVLMYPFVAAF